ncbi:MAG: hypothetical protein HQL06_04185 [Nitrospirae bacterium]|nr:hypothetical protein [Nitrospirota bacterium]
MIKFELNEDEATTLREILESYLSELRMEICDTDQMDFRMGLKEREVFIKDLLKRLETAEQPVCSY